MAVITQWTGEHARLLRKAGRWTLREFAERLGISERGISKWEERGLNIVPTSESQSILDTALRMAGAETMARFEIYLQSACLLDRATVGSNDSDLVIGDLQTARAFTRTLYDSTMSNDALDYIEEEVLQLARPQFGQPFAVRYAQLAEARRTVCDYIDDNRIPFQQQALLALASRIVGLQSHLLLDQGMYDEAAQLIQTAWLFAQGSGRTEVQAWTLGVRSLISFWAGDHRRALKAAIQGANLSSDPATNLRLTALTARSAAALGDLTTTEEAVEWTIQKSGGFTGDQDVEGTLFDFPVFKLASYQTTSLLAFQTIPHAQHACSIAADALDQTTFTGASPDELALRLDIATASLTTGDVNAFTDQLSAVSRAPHAAYTASIHQRIGRLFIQFKDGPFLGDREHIALISKLVHRAER